MSFVCERVKYEQFSEGEKKHLDIFWGTQITPLNSMELKRGKTEKVK